MISTERKSTFVGRLIKTGADIFSRTSSPESRKSIWERFPELKKIPQNKFPKNVFIVPDGNGRWATAKKLAVQMGHEKGAEVIIQAFRDFSELSEYIHYVGAWGLSIDNLKRPREEIDFLMNLFGRTIEKIYPELQNRNSRFIHLGKKDIFNNYPDIGKSFEKVEKGTKNNTGQIIYIAIGFDGKDQEIRIEKEISRMTFEGLITPDDVNEKLHESLRDGGGLIPPADLVIRSSGEKRNSGLGWIGEKSEWTYPSKLFPSFTTRDFVKQLIEYSKRERRFGERPSQNSIVNNGHIR